MKETLNAPLEADVTTAAKRVAIPAPATTSGSCRPRPARQRTFETAIIERYRRNDQLHALEATVDGGVLLHLGAQLLRRRERKQ